MRIWIELFPHFSIKKEMFLLLMKKFLNKFKIICRKHNSKHRSFLFLRLLISLCRSSIYATLSIDFYKIINWETKCKRITPCLFQQFNRTFSSNLLRPTLLISVLNHCTPGFKETLEYYLVNIV